MSAPDEDRIRARLVRLGFLDRDRAAQLLGPQGLGVWDLAANRPLSPEDSALVAALGRAADPDLAVFALARLAEAADDRDVLLQRLRESGALRTRLIAVLGTSAALGDHLATNPTDWHVLDDGTTGVGELMVRPRRTAAELQRELLRAVGVPDSEPPPWGSGGGRARDGTPDTVAALGRAYRSLVLDLAAEDLAGLMAFESVASELSDLAGAVLTAGLAIGWAQLPEGAPGCRLAVIGLGKCGGRELNYVSDVDVIFVAEPLEVDDDSNGNGNGGYLATATTLASTLMRVCGEAAWEVDAALRPEGKQGPLVRSMQSYETYYRRWADTWEFQALLKARPVAGDIAVGERYVKHVAPLVWTAADRPNFVEDVQAMRRKVEAHIATKKADRQLKLGKGGLRDVEFSVQLLQMVHGRADDTLHSGNTLRALDALCDGGYVNRTDAASLTDAYRWLRTVEHRLQLQRLRRTAEIPTSARSRRWLARSLGYRPDDRGDAEAAFERERQMVAREVRRIHEKLFYRPLLTAVAAVPTERLRLKPEAAKDRMAALGFADPARAIGHIAALTEGVSRTAAIQRAILPAMLETFSVCADPDAGLLSYRQVSEGMRDSPWYLRLLRDEGLVAERLAFLLASSRYVSDLLVRAPEALQLLSEEKLAPREAESLNTALLAAVGRRDDWEAAATAARALRRVELLRIAAADLLRLADVETVGEALSQVNDATLAAALDLARRETLSDFDLDELPVRFVVVAMGRLGGEESGYGSDADVMFVYEPVGDVSEKLAADIALRIAEEMRRLMALPAPDPPLQVDADLRPEGRQGPLVRSLESYRAYYERWSSVWESQALLRARPFLGDEELARSFTDLIDPLRYPVGGLSRQQLTEIRRIKARVDTERMPRGADPNTHTKLGRGGLADVEWSAQLLQLLHAAAVPGLRTTRTLAALRAAVEAGLLEAEEGERLSAAWRMASAARNATMLVTGRPSDALPKPGRQLSGVMTAMGYPADFDSGHFLDEYRRTTRRARAVAERVLYE
jgi:glutamate-ammonia-ligase adenylyltransferase